MPRSAPACSAPFWATDQKMPSSPWVMTAIVMSSPWTTSTVSPVEPPVVSPGAAVSPLVSSVVVSPETVSSPSSSPPHAVASRLNAASDASAMRDFFMVLFSPSWSVSWLPTRSACVPIQRMSPTGIGGTRGCVATPSTGPSPTGGTPSVMATSCSMTYRPVYPRLISVSMTSCDRHDAVAERWEQPRLGRRHQTELALHAVVRQRLRRRPSGGPARSDRPARSAIATGSLPPIVRWPVSRHRPRRTRRGTDRPRRPARSTCRRAGAATWVTPWSATTESISSRPVSNVFHASASSAGRDQSSRSATRAVTKC